MSPTTHSPTQPPTSSSTRVGTPEKTKDASLAIDPGTTQLVRLRAQGLTMTASQLLHDQRIDISERSVRGFAKDWLIASGATIIDVLSPTAFEALYERVDAPTLRLTAADQAELEKCLGFGSTRSSADLTLAVKKLAALSIGKIPVTFTPAQWDQLARRAQKRGQTIEAYMTRMVEKLCQDLWTTLE